MSGNNNGITNYATAVSADLISGFSDILPKDRDYSVFPGFCDVHVHFREPGFSYKETIKTGCAAAAHGGFTAVCTMPNLNPVPDSAEHILTQRSLIDLDASIGVYPYGSITVCENGQQLSDMNGMASYAVAFSDDGKGVQSEALMRSAMRQARQLNKVIAAHTEDDSVTGAGVINEGIYSREHNIEGISSESEWRQIERDIRLAKETGCSYHVCHISCKESVELIRKAKSDGIDISCETAPHYLLLHDGLLKDDGCYKMKPPIRSRADMEALIGGILDGTIDMIATDHAPHSYAEKSGGLKDSAFGIVGLETAFPLLYTNFVVPGVISLERLLDLMSHNPRRRFGIPEDNSFTVWDLSTSETIGPDFFLSKGKSSPFCGERVFATCMMTVYKGTIVYSKI